MEQVLYYKVLVLNRSWAVINVAPVWRALTLVYKGMARIVSPQDFSTYDFEGWVEASNAAKKAKMIHASRFQLCIPEVIVLTLYNGRFSQEVQFSRRNIFDRDGNTCQYCGRKFDRMDLTLDHVVPRCQGGKSTWENIVVACLECNVKKGSRLPHQAGMRLCKPPVKPRWATRIGVKIGPHHKPSWERFLNDAYWEVPLKE